MLFTIRSWRSPAGENAKITWSTVLRLNKMNPEQIWCCTWGISNKVRSLSPRIRKSIRSKWEHQYIIWLWRLINAQGVKKYRYLIYARIVCCDIITKKIIKFQFAGERRAAMIKRKHNKNLEIIQNLADPLEKSIFYQILIQYAGRLHHIAIFRQHFEQFQTRTIPNTPW